MKSWMVATVVALACAINLLAALTCHAHTRDAFGAQCDIFEHCTGEQIDAACETNGFAGVLGDALASCEETLAACQSKTVTSTPTADGGTTSTTLIASGSGCTRPTLVEEYDCRHYGPLGHRGFNCVVQLGPWREHCAKVGRVRLDGTRKRSGCSGVLTERASVGSLR